MADYFLDYFTAEELILALAKQQYVPGMLGADGLFEVFNLAGTKFSFENEPDDDVAEGTALPRGAPGRPLTLEKRTVMSFEITHGYPKRGAVLADEVLNARGAGTAAVRETLLSRRDKLLAKFLRFYAFQHEYLRVLCLNSPSNVLGSAPAAVVVAFGNNDAAMRAALLDNVVLPMEAALGGIPYSGLTAYCSDGYWKGFIESKTIQATLLNTVNAAELRTGVTQPVFYGDILWKRYRGGGNIKITDGQAKVVPTGVPDLFAQAFAPNDTMSSIGKGELGQPYYVIAEPMRGDKGVEITGNSFPGMYCGRPEAVLTLKLTA
jgi:hypothetical protein